MNIKTIKTIVLIILIVAIVLFITSLAFNIYYVVNGDGFNAAWFVVTLISFGGIILFGTLMDFVSKNNDLLFNPNYELIKRFEKEQEDFINSYQKNKRRNKDEGMVDENNVDEFEGDEVYDSLDDLFGFTKSVVKKQKQRDYVDADFVDVTPTNGSVYIHIEDDLASLTVVELKDICKAYSITGYSSMRKAELIEAIEEFNRAQ